MKITPSSIATFDECCLKYKLTYIDNLSKFEKNISLIFGDCAHRAIEEVFKQKNNTAVEMFFDIFRDEVDKQKDKIKDANRYEELVSDGRNIFTKEFDIGVDLLEIEEFFAEEKIKTEINPDLLFSGRLDIRYRIGKKQHIIDVKTTKAGWDFEKKNNVAVLSQPILYKYFWAKNNPETKLRDIKTSYLFLKKKTKEPVELHPVSSGPKMIEKCLKNVLNMVTLVNKKFFYKSFNKFTCKWCEFNGKECFGEKD